MGATLKIIARIHTDFPSKFGIPRQSGLADTHGFIIFEPKFRNPDSIKGIEEYSRLWLLWEFSENKREAWNPMVRPPRLGGNKRVGVFASRSPFRPNPIGLSCVELERVEAETPKGPILYIKGADLMDGTPIYDIKPYLPYVDAYPQAEGGFADRVRDYCLTVEFPEELLKRVPAEKREALRQILAQDPRPSYQEDPERMYGLEYAGLEIRFQVEAGRLAVRDVYAKADRKGIDSGV